MSDKKSKERARLWPPQKTYVGIPRMPAMFGRQPGPRQRPDRNDGYPEKGASTLATWVVMEADADSLTAFLPEGFSLAEPWLVIEAVTLDKLPWLAGRGYELLMVSVPVRYRVNNLEQRGRLELVTWEDCPDAIISGREELGWNKVYADTLSRYVSDGEKMVRYHAAWSGTKFFEMEIKLDPLPSLPGTWRKGTLMHYRVLPRTGEWGKMEVEQVTAAAAMLPLTSMRSMQGGTGSFIFHKVTFDQMPTQVHIINRLADIKLGRVIDAGQARAASWGSVSDARVLSSSAPVAFISPENIDEANEDGMDQKIPVT